MLRAENRKMRLLLGMSDITWDKETLAYSSRGGEFSGRQSWIENRERNFRIDCSCALDCAATYNLSCLQEPSRSRIEIKTRKNKNFVDF